jgi:hypothetical protein
MKFEKSSIQKVIGTNSNELQESILKHFDRKFKEQEFTDEGVVEFLKHEAMKQPEHYQLLLLSNQATNEWLATHNQPPVEIPPKNMHLIDKDFFQNEIESRGINAGYVQDEQMMIFNEANSRTELFHATNHELLHFKGYNSVQIVKTDDPYLSDYRGGLSARSRDDQSHYFFSLNEAVTEDVAMKITKANLQNNLFVDEGIMTKSYKELYTKDCPKEAKELFNDETFYIGIEDDSIVRTNFSYGKERKSYNLLCEKIAKKNPGDIKTVEDVKYIFEDSMLTGDLFKLTRLIEGCFGHGTMRKLAEATERSADKVVFEKFLENLN